MIFEPKHKRCACGVRLFHIQGESAEAFAQRNTCTRCARAALKASQQGRVAIVEAPEDVPAKEPAEDAREGE